MKANWKTHCKSWGIALALATLASGVASAQVILSGEWTPQYSEDWDERIPGPALVDYLGLPINDDARQWALSWDPDRLTLQEHQCQAHTAAYIYRGPLQLRIWEERDPETHALIAIKQYISTYQQTRTIYMDGRPHPPEYAPHTWMGFSTGKWDGDILVVTTTHIKQGWHRRNGLVSSDLITLTEYFIRHGDHLTHVNVVQDPIYLAEPMIKSQDYLLNTRPQPDGAWLWPCEYVDEAPGHPREDVQAFDPKANPYLHEFADKYKIPVEAALGGPETMYPEYQFKLKGVKPPAAAAPAPATKALAAQPAPGSARALAKTDFTGYWVSLVTEDWLYRMVTPAKGDITNSVPVNAEGKKIAEAWDPAKDEAAGNQCKAYGAAGLMRVPGRLHIAWDDDNTLRIDTDAGMQTRLLHFAAASVQDGPRQWQGVSLAQWERPGETTGDWAGLGVGSGGPGPANSMHVATTNLRPGYLRKNGVPYSGSTTLSEYFDIARHPDGDQYLIVTTVVQDPQYLTQPFTTSTHFKRQADGSGWNPSPCSAR